MFLQLLLHLTRLFLSFVAHQSVSCSFASPFLFAKGPLLFWFGPKFLTIFPFFHQTVKAGCILQWCTHLFSFLLGCVCSCLRQKSSIQHRSLVCSFIRFLIAFSDKLFEEGHVLPFLLGTMRFNVVNLNHYFFCTEIVQSFPNWDPHTSVFCFRSTCRVFPSQPIDDPFVINVNHCRTNGFPEEAQEGRQLSSLDGVLPTRQPAFRTSRASAPSPDRGPPAPLTIHTHSTFLIFPTKKHQW